MNRLTLICCVSLLSCTSLKAQSPELSIGETTKLIQSTRKTVVDAKGWATDLLEVLKTQHQPASSENVCSAIAIIDQESNFVANPAVAGLGAMAEKTLRGKADRIPILGRVALQFLETSPSENGSYMSRIRTARTERDLDLVYRSMVDDASRRSSLSFVVQSGLLNQMIEDRNDISTVGSMQVAVRFAIASSKKTRWLPMSLNDVYALRDELYTRRGGMYYGVLQLLGYDTGYNRKIFRFADYNAGRFASRNAAFQNIISILTNKPLVRDGDLLLYDKDKVALKKTSESEKALRIILANTLSTKALREDLLTEKEPHFIQTQTYLAVQNLYKSKTGNTPHFAEIPTIELNSPKISHHMTTRIFAESVEKRYNLCLAKLKL
jgi:Protein of unknown function (DUF1615)